MSELQTASAPSSSGNAAAEAKNAQIIYILYLVAFVVGVTSLVGLVMAYVNKGHNSSDWVQSHYQYQIRTFWIGLLYGVVGAITTLAFIGFAILLFFAVWYIIRCVKGLKYIQLGQPVPNATTWLW